MQTVYICNIKKGLKVFFFRIKIFNFTLSFLAKRFYKRIRMNNFLPRTWCVHVFKSKFYIRIFST